MGKYIIGVTNLLNSLSTQSSQVEKLTMREILPLPQLNYSLSAGGGGRCYTLFFLLADFLLLSLSLIY